MRTISETAHICSCYLRDVSIVDEAWFGGMQKMKNVMTKKNDKLQMASFRGDTGNEMMSLDRLGP